MSACPPISASSSASALGDVVEESDGGLMGDGVNIAARLEGVAASGAICLSEQAYWQVKGRHDLAVSDLGPTQLNKARTSSASWNVKRLRLAVIAIARLTFANMAADSGVLLGIILVRTSSTIRQFDSCQVHQELVEG